MLQIVLFRAWLNLQYPRLATPIGPLIDRLLKAEHKRGELSASYASHEELYRITFLPFPKT